MLKHNVFNHRKDEDPVCCKSRLWFFSTVLVALLFPFLPPPGISWPFALCFPFFFPSSTSLSRACSPPFTLSLTFRGTWWKSGCPTELVSLFFILPVSWHACVHFCMRWQLRGPRLFCLTVFSLCPSKLTLIGGWTGLCRRTSHKCQRKLIKVLKFFIRVHMQECEEQSVHAGVLSKEEPTVHRPLWLESLLIPAEQISLQQHTIASWAHTLPYSRTLQVFHVTWSSYSAWWG